MPSKWNGCNQKAEKNELKIEKKRRKNLLEKKEQFDIFANRIKLT